MLQKLREKDLTLKLLKSEFYKNRVKFLRYYVSEEGLGLDLDKVAAAVE